MTVLYVTDCEGPVSKNDNAFELCGRFIPGGEEFFARVSRYDDFLADVVRRPGYKAGDTLKLILPFLKAHGLTDAAMEEFSRDSILLMPGAQRSLQRIATLGPVYMVSTSYAPYIRALCRVIGLPEERAYCTAVSLDRYPLAESDAELLRGLAREIAAMPLLEWPEGAAGPEDLGPSFRPVWERLEEIFWARIPAMEIGAAYREVNPVGGSEKARAVAEILEREGQPPGAAVYVGDSITDTAAFDLVRSRGGLALSFNGNRYALAHAELACIAAHTLVLEVVARAFASGGREAVLALAAGWERGAWEEWLGPEDRVLWQEVYAGQTPLLALITPERSGDLVRASEAARKAVRGARIGALG
jgi:predicted HAD superfamily phosphohydrolase